MTDSDSSIDNIKRKRGRPPGTKNEVKKAKMSDNSEIITEMRQLFGQQNIKIDELKQELGTLKTFMVDTNKRLDAIEKKQGESSKTAAQLHQKCSKLENDIEKAIDEMELRKRCAANLVIHGIPENANDGESDINTVVQLLQKIDQTAAVKRVFRVGLTNVSNRPIKVIFSSEQQSKHALDAFKAIPIADRKVQYKNIYIDKDLTKKQQQEKKTALVEVKTKASNDEKVALREVNGHFRCVTNSSA